MYVIAAALVTTLGTALVGFAAWLSMRLTRESRLLLRIERLGNAHRALPDSPQRTELGSHLLLLAADLNAWLDVDARKLRHRQWIVGGVIYGVGVIAAGWLIPTLADTNLGRFMFGIAWGAVLALILIGAFLILQARATSLARARVQNDSEQRTQSRLEALKRGDADLLKDL